MAHTAGATEIRFAKKDEFDGEVLWNNGSGTVVVINKLGDHPRYRFTLAHEVAHMLVRQKVDSDRQLAILDASGSRRLEDFCDQVAASLLLPATWVGRAIRSYPAPLTPNVLVDLAERADVSITAVGVRLWRLGFGVALLRWEQHRREEIALVHSVGISDDIRQALSLSNNSIKKLLSLKPREERAMSLTIVVCEIPVSVQVHVLRRSQCFLMTVRDVQRIRKAFTSSL